MYRTIIAVLVVAWAFPAMAASPVRVVDGDTLVIGAETYRIHGIDAPEAGQTCQRSATETWPCGREATAAMIDLVAGGAVACTGRERDDFGRLIATCTIDGQDLGAAMVTRGLAWAFVRYADDYVAEEQTARSAGIGIWQHPTQTAWEYRAARWVVAAQEAPEGCPIKGNISRNGQIYHAPWSPWYTRTKVSPEKGERWFCDEAEALSAGWRAPIWGR